MQSSPSRSVVIYLFPSDNSTLARVTELLLPIDMKYSTYTPLIRSVICVLLLFLSKSTSGYTRSFTYEFVEKGNVNGREFEKYRATNNVTVAQWAQTMKSCHEESIWDLVLLVRKSPYSAFYFETPPVRANTASKQPFEFVLVDAPSLAERQPRFQPFKEPCSRPSSTSDEYGCVFSNLSGDATLIVPKPISDTEAAYTHLASFNRKAPDHQITALWKMVAAEYIERMDSSTLVWLSTAGLGVPWLHFRLDSRPKYYHYPSYKRLRHKEHSPHVGSKKKPAEEL